MTSTEIIFLCIFILFLSKVKHIHTTKTCDVTVNNCNYTVSLLPRNSCHGASADSSNECSTDKEKTNYGLMIRFKKVQDKITKEMKQLSKRVLRGARKMEHMIKELATKQTKRRVGQSKTCPPGFVSLDNWGSCYLFSTFNTTWYEARDFCSALDSDMVSLGTLKEHYVVTFLIKNNLELGNAEGWWTSGTFIPKTKQWMWTSDVEMRPFTFIKWAANEPNELSLQCVMLYKGDDHLWHDTLCTDKHNFICEIRLA